GPLYADVTGYYSIVFGRYGLEAAENDYLSGRAPELLPQNLVDEILGRPKRGATVITTIDAKLQQVARRALGSLPVGVVAMDPRTGEILAPVANPSYDPTPLASHDPNAVRQARRALLRIAGKPLLSRASQELFPPGSTFKLVTASAALENGMKPSTSFPNPPALQLPNSTAQLHNFGGEHCLGGAARLTLAQALQISCNVVFGEIGLRLGAARLVDQARKYGFDGTIPFETPFVEGRIPPVSEFKGGLSFVATSAIGQQDGLANPMQMALVGGAIANGGEEMTPPLVKQILDADGRVVRETRPSVWGRPISARTAGELTTMMVNVVNAGTGAAAQIPGIQVAG